jgi:hypothetical protein
MKLTLEQRKNAARDLLGVVERFEADLSAVAIKHGLSPQIVRELGDLDDFKGALRKEAES